MVNSYGQFTLWVSVYHLLKSEPSCTSHKPRASYQRWLVRGDLEHEICPHAATQSYVCNLTFGLNLSRASAWGECDNETLLTPCFEFCGASKKGL